MQKSGLLKRFFFIILMLSLSACANVAVTSAQAVYNRHTIQKNFNDQYITFQAFKAIHVHDTRFKDTNISIATFNGEVLLAGQVSKPWQKEKAGDLVRSIPNVERVYNLIAVRTPSSTLKYISDAWITAKVKAKLIASSEVDATQIKVVTENGTVYLMGILFPDQAQTAVDIASNTAGVESVMKIFSYITISKKNS